MDSAAKMENVRDEAPTGQDKFDYAASRAYLQKKHAAIQTKRFELWQKAQADAQKIIEMIIRHYNPQQVLQWGSVLAPQHFSEASDIDLAVAGVDPVVFLRLLAEAEELTEFPLHLIRWEDVAPAFQQTILMKGKVVYAQP